LKYREILMKKVIAFLICAVLVSGAGLFAEDEFSFTEYGSSFKPFSYTSARNTGMGGYYSAYGSDATVLFSNPGLLASTKEFSIIELSVPGVQLSSEMGFEDILAQASMFPSFSGPLALGYVGGGFGLGLFNTVHFVGEGSYIDLIVPIGYAARLGDGFFSVDIGATIKLLGRVGGTAGNMLAMFTDYASYLDGSFWLGAGLDVGAVVNVGPVKIGVSATDFAVGKNMGTVNGFISDLDINLDELTYFKPKLNAGVGFAFALSGIINLGVAVDYQDILSTFDFEGDFDFYGIIPNLKAGVELEILNMVAVRAGATAQPKYGITPDSFEDFIFVPTVGVGLNLFGLEVNAAMSFADMDALLGVDFGSGVSLDLGLRLAF
jgi:hypothetical protein